MHQGLSIAMPNTGSLVLVSGFETLGSRTYRIAISDLHALHLRIRDVIES